MSVRADKAVSLFKSGYNCSQSVVLAYCDLLNIDARQAAQMACGLGAGLGRMREVCGAVSGMALLAGCKHSGAEPDPVAKKKTYEAVQAMSEEFRKKNGSIICRQLLGLEKAEHDPTPSERNVEYYKKRPCSEYVADAAKLVESYLL